MNQLLDRQYALRILKMLATDFKDMDAYKKGIIDKDGNVLKKSYQLKTQDEKKAYTYLDRLVVILKKQMKQNEKRGDYNLTKALSPALWLVREQLQSGSRATMNIEGKYQSLYNLNITLAEEEILVNKFIAEEIGAAVGGAPSGTQANSKNLGVVTSGASGLYADLSAATAATINQLRQSFQIQRLLERDARGGTRYTELLRAHFGVTPQDYRLQRPEYIGGGSTYVNVNPIAQTSATSISGGATPLGNLAAMGTALASGHGFTYHAQEHGYIIGICNIRADLTYQQGLNKMWSRSTRYDFYFPVFAHLGEQAILNKEIYVTGTSTDNDVFGYQERWAEYRYKPSQITGLFKSTSAGTIDAWHYAQKFTSLPTLNTTFIQETPPIERTTAVGAAANGQQFLMDAFFDCKMARPMPMYSVPGLIDHF